MSIHKIRTHCRICNSEELVKFLSLGPTPLANSFLRSLEESDQEAWFPLDVYKCENCHLVQLLDVVDPSVLFRNYIYLTGTSDTISKHNRDYAKTVSDFLKLTPEDLVVEIASNDGSLMQCFKELPVRVLGVEPAQNIAEVAIKSGIPTINEFFNTQQATVIREVYGTASVVIGNNVLAHVDEPLDFLTGVKHLLNPSGMVVIEVPYLSDLLSNLEYDTIYHEHLCYFSIGTITTLFEAAGLVVRRVDRVPVHGGSIRIYAGHCEYYRAHAEEVLELVSHERTDGLNDLNSYQTFSSRVEANRAEIINLLKSLKKSGEKVAAYGAPAKGNTLLNYCKIGTDLLSFTVDKNPLKVGLLTPGMHIPVKSVNSLLELQPDYVLILAWNFANEIMEQQREYFARGGRFIIPIPQPVVI